MTNEERHFTAIVGKNGNGYTTLLMYVDGCNLVDDDYNGNDDIEHVVGRHAAEMNAIKKKLEELTGTLHDCETRALKAEGAAEQWRADLATANKSLTRMTNATRALEVERDQWRTEAMSCRGVAPGQRCSCCHTSAPNAQCADEEASFVEMRSQRDAAIERTNDVTKQIDEIRKTLRDVWPVSP